ncbi:MAG: efflux RND transporter periplasmic adaptor subunit [Pseudomonadota bacterium]
MNTSSKYFPYYLSAAIAGGIAIWMLSGMFSSEDESAAEAEAAEAAAANTRQAVRVQQMNASTITREVVVSGRTAANRTLELRAEAEGIVQQLGTERGNPVKAGDVIVKLDMRDRNARLKEAEALVAQRELESKGVQNLRTKQFTTEVQSAEANSRLESARAAVERIKLEIANLTIKVPYDAVLQERAVEMGNFVRIGDTVAELVDLDPIIVIGEVNEREVAAMQVGGKGEAVLVDGRRMEGTVRYLAPKADAGTLTFQVELAIPNPDNSIRAGMTAQLHLFANTVSVHNLSAALLTLADDGTIGAKVVDNTDTVRFFPVEIVGASPEGLQQVSGLPDSIRLITVGQGFVTEGQKVNAQMSTAGAAADTATGRASGL